MDLSFYHFTRDNDIAILCILWSALWQISLVNPSKFSCKRQCRCRRIGKLCSQFSEKLCYSPIQHHLHRTKANKKNDYFHCVCRQALSLIVNHRSYRRELKYIVLYFSIFILYSICSDGLFINSENTFLDKIDVYKSKAWRIAKKTVLVAKTHCFITYCIPTRHSQTTPSMDGWIYYNHWQESSKIVNTEVLVKLKDKMDKIRSLVKIVKYTV